MISSSMGRISSGFQKALSELEGQEAQRRAQQQRQAQQQQQAGQAGGAGEAGGCSAGGGAGGGEGGSGIQRPDAQPTPPIDPQVQADARQTAAQNDTAVRQQVESGCRCRGGTEEPLAKKPATGIDPALRRAAEQNGQNDQNALDRLSEQARTEREAAKPQVQPLSDEMRRAAEQNGQNDQNALDRQGEQNRLRQAAEQNGQNDQNALDRLSEQNRAAAPNPDASRTPQQTPDRRTTQQENLERAFRADPRLQRNQDLINHGYKNGGNTYEGAGRFLRDQYGLDINKLAQNKASRAEVGEGRRAFDQRTHGDNVAAHRRSETESMQRLEQLQGATQRRAAEDNGQNDQNALDRIGERNRLGREPAAAAPPATFTHHARTGETLNDVATRYGKTLTEMRAANPNLPFGSPLGAGVEVNVPRSAPNLTPNVTPDVAPNVTPNVTPDVAPRRAPVIQGPVMVA